MVTLAAEPVVDETVALELVEAAGVVLTLAGEIDDDAFGVAAGTAATLSVDVVVAGFTLLVEVGLAVDVDTAFTVEVLVESLPDEEDTLEALAVVELVTFTVPVTVEVLTEDAVVGFALEEDVAGFALPLLLVGAFAGLEVVVVVLDDVVDVAWYVDVVVVVLTVVVEDNLTDDDVVEEALTDEVEVEEDLAEDDEVDVEDGLIDEVVEEVEEGLVDEAVDEVEETLTDDEEVDEEEALTDEVDVVSGQVVVEVVIVSVTTTVDPPGGLVAFPEETLVAMRKTSETKASPGRAEGTGKWSKRLTCGCRAGPRHERARSSDHKERKAQKESGFLHDVYRRTLARPANDYGMHLARRWYGIHLTRASGLVWEQCSLMTWRSSALLYPPQEPTPRQGALSILGR